MAGIKGQGSAQPKSLESPVPGKQQELTADSLLQQFNAPEVKAPASTTTPGSADALLQQFGSQTPSPDQSQEQSMSPGMQALDATGRVLDYPGGYVRAGLANVAGLATGKGNIVTPEDLKQVAKGKGPMWSEYLKRLGVSEGGSVEVPGLGRVTVRGIEGLGLDIASDPLTAVTKLTKEVPYIGKLLDAPNKASEAVGEAVYKSALEKVDAKLAAKGKAPVSEIALQEGLTGTTEQIAKKVSDMSQVMGKLRDGLYDKATQLGVSVDMGFPLKNAERVLADMRKNPGLEPAAQELQGLLDSYKKSGKIPVQTLSEWKTQLYDALPATAFDGYGKLKTQAQRFKYALASDFRDAIVQAGNKAEKGLGDSINAINEKWGTLLSAQKPLDRAAAQSTGNWVDGVILGAGGLKGYAVKKAYDLGTGTYARTRIGQALISAGQDGMTAALTRRALVNMSQPQAPQDYSAIPGIEPAPTEPPPEGQ